jgi:hypothetical protein
VARSPQWVEANTRVVEYELSTFSG